MSNTESGMGDLDSISYESILVNPINRLNRFIFSDSFFSEFQAKLKNFEGLHEILEGLEAFPKISKDFTKLNKMLRDFEKFLEILIDFKGFEEIVKDSRIL